MRQPINNPSRVPAYLQDLKCLVSEHFWLSLLPNDWGMRFGDGVRSPLGCKHPTPF